MLSNEINLPKCPKASAENGSERVCVCEEKGDENGDSKRKNSERFRETERK